MASALRLAAALHSGDPAFASLPDYFRSRFEPAPAMLMDAAARSGEVRADVAPYDLLRAIGNLAAASGEDGAAHTERMVQLLLDGLRHDANAAAMTRIAARARSPARCASRSRRDINR